MFLQRNKVYKGKVKCKEKKEFLNHQVLQHSYYNIINIHYSWILFVYVNLPTSWNVSVTPKSIFTVLSWPLPTCTQHQSFESPNVRDMPNIASWGDVPPSCFSSRARNKCSFCNILSAMVSTFLCFLLVTLLFKTAPSTVLKCHLAFLSARRLWHALQRKYRCFLGCSCAFGCEFNVNELIIYVK